MTVIFRTGLNHHYLVMMPSVATMATAVVEIVMAVSPTRATAPAVIIEMTATMMTIELVDVRLVTTERVLMAAAMLTARVHFHDSWIGAAMAPAASMIRWYRRQLTVFLMALELVLPFGPVHGLTAMTLHSLHFLHLMPIVRWNVLVLQYNIVQLTSFECSSMMPLFIVLQLKCI